MPLPVARAMLIVMLCPTCGKESHNIRVCAHCQTPYPTEPAGSSGGARRGRSSQTMRSQDSPGRGASLGGIAEALQNPRIRWGLIAVLALVVVGYAFMGRETAIPTGVAIPNLIKAPMSLNEAKAYLKTVEQTAQVEVGANQVTVRLTAGSFPQQRAGQMALAQQYARADELVQQRKRLIVFLDPDGAAFAKADPAIGVLMTR